MKAFVSQRLLPRESGSGRIAALEVMLNSPLIADLVFKGEVAQIKEVMAKSTRLGMRTFDQSLFDLYEEGVISYEEALRNADSMNEVRLRIKLESKRGAKDIDSDKFELVDDESEDAYYKSEKGKDREMSFPNAK
jgi:twitching motility protein PilU